MSTKLVKGTAVVSLEDGTKLGTVDTVYLDPARQEIVGFSFHQGGLFKGRTSGLVDVSDVHAFGTDAVTITSATAVRSELAIADRCDALMNLEDLLKRKVLTQGGTFVGQVVSVRFGQDSYKLTGIEVSPGHFKDHRVIPSEQVAQIGTELVLVDDAVCAGPLANPEARQVHTEPRLVRVA